MAWIGPLLGVVGGLASAVVWVIEGNGPAAFWSVMAACWAGVYLMRVKAEA